MSVNKKVCAICTIGLDESDEPTFTLNCGHRYHDFCIRGWTIIGKKDTCPCCAEKVSLSQTFTKPWEKASVYWANLMDMVRYLVVWNPVIIFIVNTSLQYLD